MTSRTPTVERTVHLELPELNLKRLDIKIRGTTPLITNRFGERAVRAIEDRQQRQARGRLEARDPQREMHDALYLIDEENEVYGFPATGFKNAVVSAGIRFTEHKGTILRGAFNIQADLLKIESPKGPVMRTDHVVRNGSGNVAYRPMFDPWTMSIPVVLYETAISVAEFVNTVRIAGFAIGLGDWRPEKDGVFGTYELSLDDVEL